MTGYVNVTDTDDLKIPYFVYGTLRPGMGNDHRWRSGRTATRDEDLGWDYGDGQVICPGYSLVVDGLPFAVQSGDKDSYIVGCLIFPIVFKEEALRQSFDSLEGHPTAYRRVLTTVYSDTRREGRPAWIYEWPHAISGRTAFHEPSGDYALASDYEWVTAGGSRRRR